MQLALKHYLLSFLQTISYEMSHLIRIYHPFKEIIYTY